MMRRLLDRLASLRLTVGLLVALVVLMGLGLAIPQKTVLQRDLYEQWRAESPELVEAMERAGLTDVFRSPAALALWGAFFVHLGLVMARRAPGTLRRLRIDGPVPRPEDASGFSYRAAIGCGEGGLEAARRHLVGAGYAVHVEGGRLRAVRFRLAPLATLGFHLSFFLIAGGAGLSSATRFAGMIDLGEGETFSGQIEQYAGAVTLPRFGRPPDARFTVERVEPEMVGGVPVSLRIAVRDETFALGAIEVNRPYRAQGASFVFKNLGVAPALVVTDPDGAVRFEGYMRLDVLQGRTDRFRVGDVTFDAALFPDYVDQGPGDATRSQEMRNPVLRLSATAPRGHAVTARLRVGDVATLGPYTVAFPEWRYWVRLYVRSERGIGAIWLGLALGAASLAFRLFLYRREYLVGLAEDGRTLQIAGRAEYYRALFEDEAQRTVAALARALEAGGPGASTGGRSG